MISQTRKFLLSARFLLGTGAAAALVFAAGAAWSADAPDAASLASPKYGSAQGFVRPPLLCRL